MSGYNSFAAVYDLLTVNVPYDEIAEYYNNIIVRLGGGRQLFDMGCGTGNLTVRLAEMGYDIVAADSSVEMLSIAVNKPHENIQYICQSMTAPELYNAAEVVISTLDSINHLECEADIAACFRGTADNLVQGGLFLFDVNTVYKHEHILADNTFVYDVEGAYCVWQNEYCPEDNGVDIELDLFFEEEDGSYTRDLESFREIALPQEKIEKMLAAAGFKVEAVYEYLTEAPPKEKSEKLMFAARKL